MYLYIKTFGNNNNNKKNQLLDKIHYYFHPTHEAEQRGRGAGRGRGETRMGSIATSMSACVLGWQRFQYFQILLQSINI